MSTLRCKLSKKGSEGMNIWDSVQRGLEKATQEATRLARTQRLRATVDKLTQQIHTREDDLLVRTMEVFAAGQLTQSELLPICQEVAHLQQQLEQAQYELKVANQGIQQTPPSQPGNTFSHQTSALYDQTQPPPTPPPPPGMEHLSSFSTIRMGTPNAEKPLCSNCHIELVPGNAFCHNCGTPIGSSEIAQQATVRAEAPEPHSGEHATPEANTIANPPEPQEKDGGS